MNDTESSCPENIWNRDELTAQLESSFKRQRCEAFADVEQHEWVLPDERAFHANTYLQKFIKGKNLKDSILNENPVSTNTTKPWKLDENYKKLLEENRAETELALNGTLEKIQSKTLNTMGPLKKLWFRSDEVLAQENNMYS